MDHTTGEGWAYIDGTLIQYNSGMNHTGKVALGWDTNNQNTVAGTQHVKYVDDIVVAEVACGSPPAGGWIGPYNGSRGY
jgi:hypothetical protein